VPDTAVLLSSGVDSAVLAASEARHSRVRPIYVRTGLAWEEEERAMVGRLLQHPLYREVQPLTTLELPVRDVYPERHWAIRGTPPGLDSADEDVYLAGRNIVLLAKTAIHCSQHGIERVALGLLRGNPFPDATPEFLETMAAALSLGLSHRLNIAAPFSRLNKADVIREGAELGVPFELTLSCLNPADGRHCGRCNKCRERRDAFIEAGVTDPTPYG
jgi:7-cyano-7-deazaguanine synthase